MFPRILKAILLSVLIPAFFLPGFKIGAETQVSSEICESIEEIDKKCQDLSPSECREFLGECQRYFEEKSIQIEKDITKTEQEKKTLQNQIYILNNKITNLAYQIYQSNLVIKDLGLQIEDTENSIEKTSLKISQSCEKLIFILRTIYDEDQKSVVEIFLAEARLSDFFDDLVALEQLSAKNKELLENIKEMKSYLESQKQALDEEKQGLENLVTIQTLQKKENEGIKSEREYFLKLTEAEYQKYLTEKKETEKRAEIIRSRIFDLIGVPEAPTFGEAYEIAKFVSAQTGIRPALLLAVLTQESNIGKNVGQCFLTNLKTGEGVRVKTGEKESRTMKPDRDVPHFLEITKELGRDPYNTPVSCPLKDKWGNPIGWGGAMGPSQFIPSTWVLYRAKVSEVTGRAADPWNIKDAFLATGIYLRDLGGIQNEFKAVMRYFSGYTWSKWEEFYGRSVLSIAENYEADIKELEKAK